MHRPHRRAASASGGARADRRRVFAALILALAGSLGPGGAAAGQDPPTGAMLVGTVYDSTSAAPLSGAAIYLVGTTHVTVSNAEGAFALPGLAAGAYSLAVRHARFDSIGLETAPTWSVELDGTGVTRIDLAIPSMASLMPNLCSPGSGTDQGIAVGTIRDAATGTPLPRATVEFDARTMQSLTVETDNQGRYVACGLPVNLPIVANATFFRRAPAMNIVSFVPDQPVVTDFELELSPGVEVAGRVVDQSTNGPVAGAVVTIESSEGEVARLLTDDGGRFEFDRLELDTYLVQVQHLAYGTQMKWFTVADVEPIDLELGLVPDAIELDALVVNVTSRGLGRGADPGVRRDFVSRLEIEELLGSVRNVGDLVRTIPGVRVSNLRDPVTGQMRLCVEGRRTATSACDSVTVVIDGIIEDIEMLEDLAPNVIESIEFIPSLVAGTRYGVRTGSGVLEITTIRR